MNLTRFTDSSANPTLLASPPSSRSVHFGSAGLSAPLSVPSSFIFPTSGPSSFSQHLFASSSASFTPSAISSAPARSIARNQQSVPQGVSQSLSSVVLVSASTGQIASSLSSQSASTVLHVNTPNAAKSQIEPSNSAPFAAVPSPSPSFTASRSAAAAKVSHSAGVSETTPRSISPSSPTASGTSSSPSFTEVPHSPSDHALSSVSSVAPTLPPSPLLLSSSPSSPSSASSASSSEPLDSSSSPAPGDTNQANIQHTSDAVSIIQAQTTSSSPVFVTTNSNGQTTLSEPPFITSVSVSTLPDGAVSSSTSVLVNPTGVGNANATGKTGFFAKSGEVAGVFVLVGAVVVAVLARSFVLRRRRPRGGARNRVSRPFSLSGDPFQGPADSPSFGNTLASGERASRSIYVDEVDMTSASVCPGASGALVYFGSELLGDRGTRPRAQPVGSDVRPVDPFDDAAEVPDYVYHATPRPQKRFSAVRSNLSSNPPTVAVEELSAPTSFSPPQVLAPVPLRPHESTQRRGQCAIRPPRSPLRPTSTSPRPAPKPEYVQEFISRRYEPLTPPASESHYSECSDTPLNYRNVLSRPQEAKLLDNFYTRQSPVIRRPSSRIEWKP